MYLACYEIMYREFLSNIATKFQRMGQKVCSNIGTRRNSSFPQFWKQKKKYVLVYLLARVFEDFLAPGLEKDFFDLSSECPNLRIIKKGTRERAFFTGRRAVIGETVLISNRGAAPGRVRFLTDVKNVTRMQSKLCQPVRFIISPVRVSVRQRGEFPFFSREKFNSRPGGATLARVPLRNSTSLSLLNIRSRGEGGHLRSSL